MFAASVVNVLVVVLAIGVVSVAWAAAALVTWTVRVLANAVGRVFN